MNILKEMIKLSDNATILLCDIEKLDYTADTLMKQLERIKDNTVNKLLIEHIKTAINIMFDYISDLEKSINITVRQTDAVCHYIKEQQSNEQKRQNT